MKEVEIKLSDLRRIVQEEVSSLYGLQEEGVDHAGIKEVVNGASKLLAAVEGFKKSAPASAIHAVTPHIDELARVLEDMLSTPGSYVPKPKLEPQHVSLKPVKGEGKEPKRK